MKTRTSLPGVASLFPALLAGALLGPTAVAQVTTNLPPTVRLTSPADGAVFAAPADIEITAEAEDPDGMVAALEVVVGTVRLNAGQADGPLQPMGGSASFRTVWANVPAGEYLLAAVAKDNAGASAVSTAVRIVVTNVPTNPRLVSGYLRRQVYLNIPGIALADLTNHARFPDQPDQVGLVSAFETPWNVNENYGVRLTGFVIPPITGDYIFYIASDDQGALFLSSDESPANRRQIAYEPQWAPSRVWTGFSMNRPNHENISAPIRLEAGRRYYVEALMKEGGGGDNLGVIWQKPGDPTPMDGEPPIPGEYLAVYWPDPITNPPPEVEIVQPGNGQGFLLGAPIEIIAVTPVVPPTVDRVEFWANGVKIGDGIELPTPRLGVRRFGFTWTNAPLGQHVVVANAFTPEGDIGPFGVSAPVWIVVYDQHVQVVTIEATDAVASEPGVLTVIDNAEFTVRRTGGASRPLTVFYRIGGAAQNGTDYERLTGAVTLGEDENRATISVNALRDERVEGDESVVLTLLPPILPPGGPEDPVSEGRWFYLIGTPGSAEAVIHDANPPVNQAPEVRIAEPRDGGRYSAPAILHIIVSTVDRDGVVKAVEVFDGEVKLGDAREMVSDAGPGIQGFGLLWTNPPVGAHVLTARATDDDGAQGTSAPVHIAVQPPAGSRELHVVGVYSGMSNGSSSANHERGDAAVVVNRPGKYVTLFLSSYEPVLWHLTLGEGTVIERLMLGGYYEQSVEGLPPGVEVITAYPGGPQPGLWMGYTVESGQFYRTLAKLHAMTGLEIASFHGSYTAPYPTPFVIDAVQDDPRLRSDYPQPTPPDQLPDLQFSVDFFNGTGVFSQAYSLRGPVTGASLLPGALRVTANADRTKFYGLDGNGILEADALSGSRVIQAPSDVLQRGWLMGATFDPVRRRALLVTLEGDGALYGYVPASGLWSTISSMNNIDLCSLAYHPGLDVLFGLEVSRSDSGRPVLDRFSPDGLKLGEIRLPFMPFDIGVIGHRAELVPVGEWLVMLVAPMGPAWDGAPADERMYLIDPLSGQVWLTFRSAGSSPNRPPKVEIVRPVAGDVFQAPADLSIVVQAVDPDGWVPLVELFADGNKIGEQRVTPITTPQPGQMQSFSLTWRGVPVGPHVLTVKAADDRNATAVSAPVSFTVIGQELPPVVSISAPDPLAAEQPIDGQTNTATFRIRRTGATNAALRVWYSVHGTAENGRDYVEIPGGQNSWGSVEIPAGRRSARLVIQPINDGVPEGIETVWLQLEPAPTLAPIEPYRIGSPRCAGALIVDDALPVWPPVVCLPDGALRVSLPGADGMSYRLECSTDLTDWLPLADGVASGGYIHYLDMDAAHAPSRFFRLQPVVQEAVGPGVD